MSSIVKWIGIGCVGVFLSVEAAQVYKWVDENGQVHYSDKPHENAEKLNIDGIKQEKNCHQELTGIHKKLLKGRWFQSLGDTSYLELRDDGTFREVIQFGAKFTVDGEWTICNERLKMKRMKSTGPVKLEAKKYTLVDIDGTKMVYSFQSKSGQMPKSWERPHSSAMAAVYFKLESRRKAILESLDFNEKDNEK